MLCLISCSRKDFTESFTTGDSATSAIKIKAEYTNTKIVDDDKESMSDDKLFEVNSAIAVEKEIAADIIGTVFAATGQHPLPSRNDQDLLQAEQIAGLTARLSRCCAANCRSCIPRKP